MTEPRPLVIAATSGAVTELVGIVQNPRPGSPRYAVTALFGEGALLREISDRLAVPLLDDLSSAAIPPGTHIAITAGNHLLHQQWVHIAMARNLEVATLIHADTTIGPWVEIGVGCVIAPGVRVTGNVTIGAHCQLNTGAIVSHDDVLGDYVTLSPSTTLCGSVVVGARSTIFAGATVMPDITIGADVIVGAGALVNRNIADGTTVVGVPARPLQGRTMGVPD